ncbi:tannase/feruloyl esterase family alpha/beta hydrolase [Oceanicola sp. S124]|uniref:tannase/feruloyl esterase family alpha/beta hydrolase n=1 Tax=Oceanicola sp. S124 TaxID=1042378 RepID=UPI00143BA63D|nr:tannase/feruloyl esterase family alpha/beta hydrolase [Oceanicola sp. S124]
MTTRPPNGAPRRPRSAGRSGAATPGRLALASALAGLAMTGQALAAGDCAALADFEAGALSVTGAELVAASATAPEACVVMASLAQGEEVSPINFRVTLPTEWSGRSVQYGGGGFNGRINDNQGARWQTPEAQAAFPFKNHVTFEGDSGHQNGALPLGPDVDPRGASFALVPEEFENYAGASVGKTFDAAMQIVEAHYGRLPDYSYFVGFSQGGKEAMVAAQRHPENYDGILAGDPVAALSGLKMAHLKSTRAFYANGGAAWVPPATAEVVTAEIIAQCDGLDGLEDGWIGDFEGCQPDLSTMLCEGAEGEDCLSEAQLAAINEMHAPVELDYELPNGLTGHAGYPWGNVAWSGSFLGTRPQPGNPVELGKDAYVYGLGDGYARFFVAQDPGFDALTFDENDPALRDRILEVAQLIDATDPDLTPLAEGGSKLILYAGGASEVPPAEVAAYWRRMVETTGVPARDFARFYIFPAITHAGVGPEGMPAASDLFSALEAWVETGTAPGPMVNSSPKADLVTAERPLCEYPAVPRYDGAGDPMLATSFSCLP